MIRVRDDGPGVAEADRERVFERFTRLDDARARDFGGTGLGLAIVRELVRRAGGEVALADGCRRGGCRRWSGCPGSIRFLSGCRPDRPPSRRTT